MTANNCSIWFIPWNRAQPFLFTNSCHSFLHFPTYTFMPVLLFSLLSISILIFTSYLHLLPDSFSYISEQNILPSLSVLLIHYTKPSHLCVQETKESPWSPSLAVIPFALAQVGLLAYIILIPLNCLPPLSYILRTCHRASLLTLSYALSPTLLSLSCNFLGPPYHS